jgi:hypothetical protein
VETLLSSVYVIAVCCVTFAVFFLPMRFARFLVIRSGGSRAAQLTACGATFVVVFAVCLQLVNWLMSASAEI